MRPRRIACRANAATFVPSCAGRSTPSPIGAVDSCNARAVPGPTAVDCRPWRFWSPADANGSRLRLVFGIAAGPGLGASRAVPTNITVIVEGGKQLYATQGDDKCQIESMVQEPVTPTRAAQRAALMREYRIAARGYCIDPAASLDGSARLYIDRFDFAGLARFAENELYASNARQ